VKNVGAPTLCEFRPRHFERSLRSEKSFFVEEVEERFLGQEQFPGWRAEVTVRAGRKVGAPTFRA
jgi:hypothetical protein